MPIERGGRVTWHGPGQLVVYPIVPLPRHDVRAWLRRSRRSVSRSAPASDSRAEPSVDGTGVFVDGRKIASIGVAVRHWINLHGIAINVDVDLAQFARIRPCGLDPAIMTDLSHACGRRCLDSTRHATRRGAAIPDLLPIGLNPRRHRGYDDAPMSGSIELDRDGRHLLIRFPYREDLVDEVRSLPGRRWDRNQKVWRVPGRPTPNTS